MARNLRGGSCLKGSARPAIFPPGSRRWSSVRVLGPGLGLLLIGHGAVFAQVPEAVGAARRLSLDEAIGRALESAPGTVGSATDVALAEADRLEERGTWLPSMSVSTGYTNSSDERVDTASGRLVSESYTAQATANLQLFQGGRRIWNNRSANALVASARAEHRAEIFSTILATTEVFYAAAAATDLDALAVQRLERARQQLDFARTRTELGTATASDLLRAELELGNAELAVLDARAALRSAALELGRMVGMAEEVLPEEASLPGVAPALPERERLVTRALGHSPLVVGAEAALQRARAERLSSFAPYLPSVGLTGGYDWISPEFPPERRSWNVRVTATLPVFDRFAREAQRARADARLREAEAVARDALIAARVEVENAVQEILSAAERVTISERARDLATEDLRVLEERYQAEVATILDLQASQVALTQAEVDAVRARQSLGTAVARLEAILGETIEEAARE